MIARLSITTLMAAVQKVVERNTSYRCYDAVPENAVAPFYFVEVVSIQPKNAKFMYVDAFNLYIHCIAEASPSSVQVHELIQKLQEALTEEIALDLPYRLLRSVDNGVIVIKTDETGEKHAVCSFTFEVSYGFICK